MATLQQNRPPLYLLTRCKASVRVRLQVMVTELVEPVLVVYPS